MGVEACLESSLTFPKSLLCRAAIRPACLEACLILAEAGLEAGLEAMDIAMDAMESGAKQTLG